LSAAGAELLMGDRSRTKVNVDIQSLKSLPTADKQHPNPQATEKAATEEAERPHWCKVTMEASWVCLKPQTEPKDCYYLLYSYMTMSN